MKKALFVTILALLCVLLCIDAFAEDYEKDILGSMSEAAENVEGAENFELFGEDVSQSGDNLLEFLSAERVLDELFGIGKEAASEALSLMLVLLGLVLICAVCKGAFASDRHSALATGAEFVSTAAICAAILRCGLSSAERVADFFERLEGLMASIIPISGAVLAMGGNVMSAGVSTATLYLMMSFTGGVCAASVMPVCFVSGTAAVCSSLSGGAVLDGFCGAVKKIYNFILGLVVSVFVFVLGTQMSIASAADTAAARAGKFVSSVVIPGVGGAIGDTIRTLAGSVAYIKSIVGVGGIVLVALLTLPILANLLLCRLAFLVSSVAAQMLGCDRESRLLCELGNIYGFLVGAVSICSVAFAVAMALFVKCTVAIE